MTLIRVCAPHFCAAVVLEDGKVVRSAPILRYMLGWSDARVRSYVASKRWTV